MPARARTTPRRRVWPPPAEGAKPLSNGTLELSLPQAGGRLALARALAHWRAFLVRVLLPLVAR